MSNIVSAVSLKEAGKLSVTYDASRAPTMGRHTRPTREMYEAAQRKTNVSCPTCANNMKLLTTHEHKKDELYCEKCGESVPLYE